MTPQDDVARLLAEILADPASEAARLVYADHLIELGDPRGELVQAQITLEKVAWNDPQRRVLEERVGDLLAIHETAWTRDVRVLGFDDHLQQVSLRRGFVERVSSETRNLAALVPALRTVTPLREIHVTAKDDRTLDDIGLACALEGLSIRATGRGVDKQVAARLPHWPHRGTLQMLALDGPEAALAVAATPALASLRRLRMAFLGAAGLSALAGAAHLAQVHTLEVPQSRAGAAGLAHLARGKLVGLKRLQIEQAQLGGDDIATLATAPFAKQLVQLRVHHNEIGDTGARALASQFPALELLDVEAAKLPAEGAAALLGSTALAQLSSLDLSRNPLDGAAFARVGLPALRHLACVECGLDASGVTALAEANLGELTSIDLSENAFGDAGLAALARTERLAKLEVLRVRRTGIGARSLADLGRSPLASRLRILDLGRNLLDDDALIGFLGRNAFASLDTLELAGAALTSRGVAALVASPLAARIRRLTLTNLTPGALAPLLAADLPELRSLVANAFDDEAARILANARGLPRLNNIVFPSARHVSDAGARLLAESAQLQHVLWFELDAPGVSELGRETLRRRFQHHIAVFAGGTLHAFSALGRRI